MKRLRSPKACAALVMIAWLASLVSLWGFDVAGNRGIAEREPRNCSVKEDLQSKSVQLEMASGPDDVLAALNGDPDKADCIRRGETAEVAYADTFFLAAYSLLILALFLFVRALRPSLSLVLLVLGVLLALTAAVGDLVENLHLLDVIRLAGANDRDGIGGLLPGLKTAAFVKMGAIALASLVLGALWPRSRWAWVLRLSGFAAAALFVLAMLQDQNLLGTLKIPMEDWETAGLGMIAFAAFAFAAVIHAVAAMADREQYSVSQPVQAQGGPKS
jgi:hypothetical protein